MLKYSLASNMTRLGVFYESISGWLPSVDPIAGEKAKKHKKLAATHEDVRVGGKSRA